MTDQNEGASAPAQKTILPEHDYAMQALHYRGLMVQAQSMALDLRRELFLSNQERDGLKGEAETLRAAVAALTPGAE